MISSPSHFSRENASLTHFSNKVMDILYDDLTEKLYYKCSSVTYIEDFNPQRFHHHKILDLAIESSRGRQNCNFVLQNRDAANRFSFGDILSLPTRVQVKPGQTLKYQQVHSARSDPEFHSYIAKLPKSSKPKAKGRHLSNELRSEYYKLFGYALRPGLELPVQDLKMTYTEATGKDVDSSTGAVPRPMNSFLTFSHCLRGKVNTLLKDEAEKQQMLAQGINYLKLLENSNCKTLQNSTLSKALSEFWNFELLQSEKQFWDDESKVLLKLHNQQFPDYKYRPQRPQKKQDEDKSKAMKRSRPSAMSIPSKKIKLDSRLVLGKTDTLTSSPVGQFVNHSPEPASPSSCGSTSPLGRGLEANLESIQMTFKPPPSSTVLEATEMPVISPISPAMLHSSSASTTTSSYTPVSNSSYQSNATTVSLLFSTYSQNTATTNLEGEPLSPMLSSVATTSNYSQPLVSHVMQNPSSAGSHSFLYDLADSSYATELFSEIPDIEFNHTEVEDIYRISDSDLLPLHSSFKVHCDL